MDQLLRDSFGGRKHAFIIAIHVGPNETDTRADIKVAHDEGADGIIVIKDYHTVATDREVLAAYREARERYPNWWIGVNLLDYSGLSAIFSIRKDVSALWIDNSHIDETGHDGAKHLYEMRKRQQRIRPRTLLLPSVAFKYQQPVKDFARVARLAAPYADGIVTSGERTGSPADLEKVRIMVEAVGNVPVGLASGVSAENVQSYIDLHVYFFIINTSISTEKGRLDIQKVRAMRTGIPC